MALPKKYTMDSIILDLMEDPEAAEVLAPLMGAIKQTLSPDAEGSEAANEAITEEMNMAMLQFMPLRGILSFGGGNVELSGLQGLLGTSEEE